MNKTIVTPATAGATSRALAAAVPPAILAGAMAHAFPRAIIGQRIRADVNDPKAMIGQLQAAFDAFKAANDEKLKGKADAVLDEKVQKIDAAVGDFQKAIDDLNAKMAAQRTGDISDRRSPEQIEYASAFNAHVRTGDIQAAMSRGSDADGGYTAPVEWDRTISDKLKLVSPIREHATVQPISKAGFKKLFNDRVIGSGWVGETAARPETGTPGLSILDFLPGELYANASATQTLLDDSEIDIEAWLQNEIEPEFARQEAIAFLSGNGTNKPFGVLTYVTGAANAAKHPWGAITVVNSGAAAALTGDGIISIIYDLPKAHSANAKFFMNRQTQSKARLLKDGQNNYLWQPSFQAGQPATLAGEAVVDTPDMPNVAADNIAALYGDMRETYLVIDRIGIRVLRDPYTNKPFVMFYVTKRVGGGVKNPQSMRALKIAANT
ncbi:phage major capsid protein [Caulobacter zeae]|uniref:Phage major capsid protein n=1 Tax=Caulobacter zeae TaxID=2055137 RepID=A0A2N5DQ03_9CAUL|nr:phage major capsid protein [Caulobacter zeae]PLR28143.1 phage major capsid protein [Caulobacter zeae]